MELYLQFGYGMMTHTTELLRAWGSGGVILSPRDLNAPQLVRMANAITDLGREALLDPQCFAHDCDHSRLIAHEYFQRYQENPTGSFTGGIATAGLLSELAVLARSMGLTRHILPGPLARPVNDDWFSFQENTISEAPTHFGSDPLIATIAISRESIMDEAQIEAVVERASQWNVQGYYIVAEAPSPYLVDNPVWVANLLILASGLKLLGRQVILGYSNHQFIVAAAANVDVIASGTWLNVRALPSMDRFYEADEGDISRRAIWYYCPHALSEYKLPFLDIARRRGVLADMRPAPSLGSTYADILFSGPAPSSINWGEQNAFRHYLTCLHGQINAVRHSTYQSTMDAANALLDTAQNNLATMRRNGVLAGDRDFSPILDANRSALLLLNDARGERLSRAW